MKNLITISFILCALSTQAQQYTYDNQQRLVRIEYPNYTISYTYDASGNRMSKSVTSTILPIDWEFFSAEKHEETKSKLSWVFTTDDSGEFIIEHSTDGVNFATIGTVTNSGGLSYWFMHDNPDSGANYYRVKYNNEYTHIEVLHFDHDIAFQIAPNPTTGKVEIIPNDSHSSVLWQKLSLSIIDNQGKEAIINSFETSTHSISINIKSMSNGVYLLKIIYEDHHEVHKIIKID